MTDAIFALAQQATLYASYPEGNAMPELPDWWMAFEKRRSAELDGRWERAWNQFVEGRGSCPLVLSVGTVEALKNLDLDRDKARRQGEHSDAYWNAYYTVLTSAKADLKLSV